MAWSFKKPAGISKETEKMSESIELQRNIMGLIAGIVEVKPEEVTDVEIKALSGRYTIAPEELDSLKLQTIGYLSRFAAGRLTDEYYREEVYTSPELSAYFNTDVNGKPDYVVRRDDGLPNITHMYFDSPVDILIGLKQLQPALKKETGPIK